jgi:Tol biopolymer transport system component
VVFVAMLLDGCASHKTAPPTGVIYLVATRDAATDVYRVNPDGSGLERLRSLRQVTPGQDAFSVAPSGNVLSFVSDERAYFAAPDGSHVRPEKARFGEPSTWSPDGRDIASASSTGEEAFDIAGSDGKSVREIPIGSEGEPAWSPKGDLLALSEDDATGAPGANGVYTVTPTGKDHKLLFPAAAFHGEVPVELWWSPDASRLAFITSTANGAGHLYVGDVASGTVRPLTRHTEENAMVAWSPDGSRLAFSSARGDGPSKVYVVRADGTGEHVVSETTGDESSSAPQWAPDGVRLAYIRNRVGGRSDTSGDVYLVRADGTGTRRLLSGVDVGEVVNIVWASLPALPATRPPREVPAALIQPLSTLRTRGVGELTANATTAVVEEATPDIPRNQSNCGRVILWTPRTHRVVRGGGGCDIGYALDSLSLAGDAVAWNLSEWDRYPIANCLLVWHPLVASVAERAPYGDCAEWPRRWLKRQHLSWIPRPAGNVSQIVANGSTLLYNTARASCYDEAVIVRPIEQDLAQPLPVCRKGQDAEARSARLFRLEHGALVPVHNAPRLLVLDAFDGRLIAGRVDEHHVVVARLGGGIVARRSFAEPVTAIRINGSRIAVEAGRALTVFDIADRRALRFRLSSAVGAPILRSFDGTDVAYVSGATIHLLRVADARDRVLRTPPAVEPIDAQLEPSGLFYSYNARHSRDPGRVSFLPRTRLTRALDH